MLAAIRRLQMYVKETISPPSLNFADVSILDTNQAEYPESLTRYQSMDMIVLYRNDPDYSDPATQFALYCMISNPRLTNATA
jgi:hypothetical protein